MQKEELLKFIYKSQLLANTDMSCASFSWELPASAGGKKQVKNVAWQVWEAMLEMTKDVEQDLVFSEIDMDQSGEISLDEMQARAREALGADYAAESVRSQFNELDTDGDAQVSAAELQVRSTGTSSRFMFSAKHGLMRTLLREDEQTLRQRAEAGELPVSVLAILLVLECSWIPREEGHLLIQNGGDACSLRCVSAHHRACVHRDAGIRHHLDGNLSKCGVQLANVLDCFPADPLLRDALCGSTASI
jgi:hypothetical protein